MAKRVLRDARHRACDGTTWQLGPSLVDPCPSMCQKSPRVRSDEGGAQHCDSARRALGAAGSLGRGSCALGTPRNQSCLETPQCCHVRLPCGLAREAWCPRGGLSAPSQGPGPQNSEGTDSRLSSSPPPRPPVLPRKAGRLRPLGEHTEGACGWRWEPHSCLEPRPGRELFHTLVPTRRVGQGEGRSPRQPHFLLFFIFFLKASPTLMLPDSLQTAQGTCPPVQRPKQGSPPRPRVCGAGASNKPHTKTSEA